MRESTLREYLQKIMDNVTAETTLEDVYNQLSLLADIDESEQQIAKGEFYTQKEVEERSKKWLK
jgi:predicted transcriptional regulator